MSGEIKAALAQAYDRNARERDENDIADWKHTERADFCAMLAKEQKKTLLEIGAGPGKDSRYFCDRGLHVVAADLSGEMARLCRRKELHTCVVDFYNVPFPDASFDAVWALNTLLHVPKRDLPQVLRNIRAVLKPDGLFYMGVYGGIAQEGIWDEDEYTPKRFFALYPDEVIRAVVSRFFALESFEAIQCGGDEIHFQGIILREPGRPTGACHPVATDK